MQKSEANPMSQPHVADKIVEFISEKEKNSIILDIATGEGYLLETLKNVGYKNLFSADVDENNFKLDKKIYNFSPVDANKILPYSNNFFDVVISSETIEHLENPQLFLREIFRILKNDGIFILTTPNVETIFSKLYFLFFSGLAAHTQDDYTKSGHITILPSWLIERFTSKIGFQKVDHTYNCGYIPVVKLKFPSLLLNRQFGWISIYKFKK